MKFGLPKLNPWTLILEPDPMTVVMGEGFLVSGWLVSRKMKHVIRLEKTKERSPKPSDALLRKLVSVEVC